MANPKLPANTLPELIALAKSKPGVLSYSTPGEGSVHHLSQELLNLHADIRTVMNLSDVRERMARMGVEIEASTPEDFDKFIRAELLKWSAVAKQAGVKGE